MDTYLTTDRLSDAELVARVLGLHPADDAVLRLAVAMTSEGWLSGSALTEVVREVPSVGPRRVARLEACVELGRRALAARARREAAVISTPDDVVRLMKPMLTGLTREHFWALALNTRNVLLRMIEVSVGSLNASIVHPRELLREAIAVSAASVVVVHNHPSGRGGATPSGADVQLTRRLVKAGDIIGIDVLDSIVIAGDEHASMRELGLL